MRLTRALPVVTVLCLASALSACSGEDSKGDAATPSARSSAAQPAKQTDCTAKVDLTGDVRASFEGKGFAITQSTSGPPAFYQAAGKGFSISLYAEGNGFKDASAVVTAKKKVTYTTQPGSGDVEVDASGKGGQVDADAAGIKPGSLVHVKASFDC